MLQYLGVVSAQSVDAEDIQQVTFLQLAQHPPIGRAVKVLAGLFIEENLPGFQPILLHGVQLSCFVLVEAGYSHISIVHYFSPFFADYILSHIYAVKEEN